MFKFVYFFINSFTFSKHFILIRVMVDPEIILETLDRSWEYTLHTHTHVHILIHNQFSGSSPASIFSRSLEETGEPGQTHGENVRQ